MQAHHERHKQEVAEAEQFRRESSKTQGAEVELELAVAQRRRYTKELDFEAAKRWMPPHTGIFQRVEDGRIRLFFYPRKGVTIRRQCLIADGHKGLAGLVITAWQLHREHLGTECPHDLDALRTRAGTLAHAHARSQIRGQTQQTRSDVVMS